VPFRKGGLVAARTRELETLYGEAKGQRMSTSGEFAWQPATPAGSGARERPLGGLYDC
jgi:hypothetical protein